MNGYIEFAYFMNDPFCCKQKALYEYLWQIIQSLLMANHSLIHFSCLQNEENNLDWFNEQVSVKMMLRKHSEHYKHYSSLI